jgi:hypothetical protein
MDECLGLFLFGGRSLDQDERLNASGQIVGVRHPKLQSQDFFGKRRSHNVRAISARDTDCHGLVNGALEHITVVLWTRVPNLTRPGPGPWWRSQATWVRRIKVWTDDPERVSGVLAASAR